MAMTTSKQNQIMAASLVGLAIAAGVSAMNTGIPHEALVVARWVFILLFCAYAVMRKSLTVWIVAAMFVGAEFGHDFPKQAENLQVLSKIFLNLIKTIIAPLIISTLVVGIAGHS